MDGSTRYRAGPKKIETVPGAPVSVVRLRDHGRKITKAELGGVEPMCGRVVIKYQGADQFTSYRSVATLYRPGLGDLGQLCVPLFDHVLEKMDSTGIILSGYEIDVAGGVTTQYVQVWWVRTLTVGQG